MAKPPPAVTDVPIPEPPSRFADPDSTQDAVSRAYGAAVQSANLQRQHRAVLLALRDMATIEALDPAAVLADVTAKVNEIVAALAALKADATTNLVSLQPDPELV
jgi:hypothetical protein